jgi:hypothetical protein
VDDVPTLVTNAYHEYGSWGVRTVKVSKPAEAKLSPSKICIIKTMTVIGGAAMMRMATAPRHIVCLDMVNSSE